MQVICKSSLAVELENTNDAKISDTPSLSGTKVVHSQKKKRREGKKVHFTRSIKRKKAIANTAKRSKKSDASVQLDNSPVNFCEFQMNEDNNFTLESPTDNIHDKDDKLYTQ